MNLSSLFRTALVGLVLGAAATALQFLSAAPIAADHHEEASAAKFDSDGNLLRPEGYREWVFVGTPLTPNELNGGLAPFPEFHAVYIDPGSWAHYKQTGEFRDGTVLVKELISVGAKAATSGVGYFMGGYLGLEAAVKSKEHSPDEPGNWTYYSFTSGGSPMLPGSDPAHGGPYADKAKAFPTAVCASCHVASAEEDMVFTQFYPVLRAAKAEVK